MKRMITLVFMLTAISLLGCMPVKVGSNRVQTSNDKKSGGEKEGTRPTTPKTGSTEGSSSKKCGDPGIADAGQTLDYYKLVNVIGVGNGTSSPQWTSASLTQQSGASPSILVTDGRLHVRVVVKEAPSKEALAASSFCSLTQKYKTLSLKMSLSTSSLSSPAETLRFERINVGECSEVLSFTTAQNIDNDETNPFIIRIKDVYSDQSCFFDPSGTDGCEESPPRLYPFWSRNCWEIELHIATDDTKDIPR